MFSDSDWCLMIVNDRKITTDWKLSHNKGKCATWWLMCSYGKCFLMTAMSNNAVR